MKIYLEDGFSSMNASLFIYPQKLEHHSRTDNPIPEVVRSPLQTHLLHIIGEDNEIIGIEGSLSELQKLVKLMTEALKGVQE